MTYRYDQGRYGIGRLSSISDESGATQFTYNARGDILDDTRTIGGRSYTTSYTYDLADHIASITYPDRRTTVSYTRDAFGRISGIRAQGRTIVKDVTYKPFGPVSGFTFGNGVKAQYAYDQDYRLTNILAKGRDTIQNLTMAYDPASNVTAITDPIGFGDGDHDRRNTASLSQAFTYDANDRLLTATGIYGKQVFTYDADGNRLSETDTLNNKTTTKTYTYAAASNRLASLSANGKTSNFTYDAVGNLLKVAAPGPDQLFTYNARNRNSAIATQGRDHWDWDHDHDEHYDHNGKGGAKYVYNALGERVAKDVDGRDRLFSSSGDAKFIYDSQGNLIAETDGYGRVEKEYVYLNGLPVAVLNPFDIRYIHTDHLGTPQKMTNEGQQILWSRAAEPFGETVDIKGPDRLLNLRFPGQYHDTESGLDYNFFRSYNADRGRYTQADPIGLAGGINRFAYVGANPVNLVDMFGLQSGMGSLDPIEQEKLLQQQATKRGIPLSQLKGELGAPLNPNEAELLRQTAATEGAAGRQCTAGSPASSFSGSLRAPLEEPANSPPRNSPGEYKGFTYSGHAFDQLQNQGIPPSVSSQALTEGVPTPSVRYPGNTNWYDAKNNVTVITNPKGTVITIVPGKVKP